MALNTITYKGKTYREVMLDKGHTSEDACNGCAFHDDMGCHAGSVPCIPEMRKDNLNVYYVEVQDAQ